MCPCVRACRSAEQQVSGCKRSSHGARAVAPAMPQHPGILFPLPSCCPAFPPRCRGLCHPHVPARELPQCPLSTSRPCTQGWSRHLQPQREAGRQHPRHRLLPSPSLASLGVFLFASYLLHSSWGQGTVTARLLSLQEPASARSHP